MTTYPLNIDVVHPSWRKCFAQGLAKMDAAYLQKLTQSNDWLPGPEKIFNAFSLPFDKVNYVLFGESPYPRKESANGYAFWDAAVDELWSEKGLSKKVNRATSLRNIIKMLLIAEGLLSKQNASQEKILALQKHELAQTNAEFFGNLIQHGFLLLNATPVLTSNPPKYDAQAWQPFIREILDCLIKERPQVKLILFGKIAQAIESFLPNKKIEKLYAEHPYNLSFITNQQVLDFFKPLHLLNKSSS